jgi:hypothetical protein
MVDFNTALRVEKRGKNVEYVFLCEDCGDEIRRRKARLSELKSPGCCHTCGNSRHWGGKRKPFESLFNRIKYQARKISRPFNPTFGEFLEFTVVPLCTYCGESVRWIARKSYRGGSHPSNLDRKDNALGYSRENCTVCCGECNRVKGGVYSYEEMKIIGPVLRALRNKKG